MALKDYLDSDLADYFDERARIDIPHSLSHFSAGLLKETNHFSTSPRFDVLVASYARKANFDMNPTIDVYHPKDDEGQIIHTTTVIEVQVLGKAYLKLEENWKHEFIVTDQRKWIEIEHYLEDLLVAKDYAKTVGPFVEQVVLPSLQSIEKIVDTKR